MVYRKSFNEILQEEQSSRDFGPLLGKMGVINHEGQSAMDANQWEAASTSFFADLCTLVFVADPQTCTWHLRLKSFRWREKRLDSAWYLVDMGVVEDELSVFDTNIL